MQQADRSAPDLPGLVEIVRATWRDTRALRKLDRRCFSRVARYGWFTFLGLSLWPGVVALKAVADRRIVGFVAGDPRRRKGYVLIVTLSVDPDWRHQGLGEQLLRECEACFDLPRFQLMVRQSNTAAIRLYQKLSYTIVADLPGFYGDGEDGYLMEKTATN